MTARTEPRRFNPLLLLPLVISLGIGVLFFVANTRENPQQLPSALIGQPAPKLELQPLAPEFRVPVQADLTAPGVKLVNFWASWCAPCRAEHPMLTRITESGIPVFGVNYKDIDANALRFLQNLGNPFAAIGTDSGRNALDWGLYGVPETFVIDGQGTVLLRYPGPITERVFQEQIAPLLQGAGG